MVDDALNFYFQTSKSFILLSIVVTVWKVCVGSNTKNQF